MASQPSLSDLRRAEFARRVPAALTELAGPEHGTVSLPLHLAWSGLTTFDLDQPRLRMSYYRIVLTEGQHDDLVRYLNRGLLISLWPTPKGGRGEVRRLRLRSTRGRLQRRTMPIV
jgi:hypothetical protein